MTTLVTGCAGFIGHRMAQTLVEAGHNVLGLDRIEPKSSPLVGWRLRTLSAHPQFEFRIVDIVDNEGLRRALDGVTSPIDAVFHLGAMTGVRASVEDPSSCYGANLLGTLNLLEWCREFDVRRFVLASTSSVYGEAGDGPVPEDAATTRPLSPYGASKCAAEALLHAYQHLHGMNAVVLRYFTVYGPAGRPDMSVFRFVRAIAEGEPLSVYGDGTQRRDFTYVDDVVRGTVAAIHIKGFETLNLGNDRPVSIAHLIRIIEGEVGRPACIEYHDRHEADPLATWADIGRARRLLGWVPEVSIEEGIRRTVAWYHENRAWAKDLA